MHSLLMEVIGKAIPEKEEVMPKEERSSMVEKQIIDLISKI